MRHAVLRVTRAELEVMQRVALECDAQGWTEDAWAQRVSDIVGFDVSVVKPLGMGSVCELELEEVPGSRPPLVRLATAPGE